MSRRPRAPIEQRVYRGLSTMAPGGLIASASPVTRARGTLAVGAVTAVPTVIAEDNVSGFSGQTNTGVVYFSPGMAVGDLVVVWAASAGYALSSTGWTVVTSGTVNSRLTYQVMWRLADAALVDDGGFVVGLSGAGTAYNMDATLFRHQGGMRPALVGSVGTAVGASSIAYTAASGTLPWQMVGFRPTTAAACTMADDPVTTSLDTNYADQLLTGGLTVLASRGTLPWREWFGSPGTFPATTDATATISGDWFSLALALS